MSISKEQITKIQECTFAAFKAGGRLAALPEGCGGRELAKELENAACSLERGAVELRRLCEAGMPEGVPAGQKAALAPLEVAGSARMDEYGWLHIRLNTLLPHCRFTAPLWLTDTITRLLDEWEQRHGKLPVLENAVLVIEECCDLDSRQVYDQDNKGWKAVSNAIKGRLIPDDDLFTLSLCLLSRRSPEACCNICILPDAEAADFFYLRTENFPILR